jgi:tRNA A-37 threonylcarbamoyl transferase component Bud32
MVARRLPTRTMFAHARARAPLRRPGFVPGPGMSVGPFRLMELVGRGGMAEVFLARHRHLGHVRALKILTHEHPASPEHVARLLTEARATAQLHHPAIVQVFDCDVLPHGGAYIVMEYLEGEPLSRWLARAGNLADQPRLAAALTATVADALGVAHERGIVHRDLKPENLFLVPHPREPRRFAVKILDFGVAKMLHEQGLAKTSTGCLIGTPDYMAPEQCLPIAPSCVLFELLCGRRPFVTDDAWSVMVAHASTPAPTARSIAPAVPAVLDALVTRMLAKAQDDRPSDMSEVVAVLERYLGCARADLPQLLHMPERACVSRRIPGPRRTRTAARSTGSVGRGRTPLTASASRPRVWLTSLILAGCAFPAHWPLAQRAREADGSNARAGDSAAVDRRGDPPSDLHAARRRKDAGGARAREQQTANAGREPAPGDPMSRHPSRR